MNHHQIDARCGRWLKPNAAVWIRQDASRWLLPNQSVWHGGARTERKYSADQPRVPAGYREGGQWTDDDNHWTPVSSGGGRSRIRLAGEIPTGDSPSNIPKIRPPTTRERNLIARAVAQRFGPYVWLAVEAGHWLYDHRAEINSFFDEPKTLVELQAAANDPQPGYDIHHIVEKTWALRNGFSSSLVNSADNLVAIPRWRHWLINAWFQMANDEYGGLSPRAYLIGKPWNVRRAVGLKAMILFGVLKP